MLPSKNTGAHREPVASMGPVISLPRVAEAKPSASQKCPHHEVSVVSQCQGLVPSAGSLVILARPKQSTRWNPFPAKPSRQRVARVGERHLRGHRAPLAVHLFESLPPAEGESACGL